MSSISFHYQRFFITTRGGKKRTIYAPDDSLKQLLRVFFLPTLQAVYDSKVIYSCDHAFISGKNCVTNAQSHIIHRYVLKMDIQQFFQSITIWHLAFYFEGSPLIKFLDMLLVDGHLPQGFPTSPVLANIAMIRVDQEIVDYLKSISVRICYTRYSDDLTFSFPNKGMMVDIVTGVTRILNKYRLSVHPNKTKLQDKANGRAVITGVGVSMTRVHPTRKTLKKIRAAKHQGNDQSAKALIAWAKCTLPKHHTTQL